MDILKKSKAFVYRNARPLDIARWNYLFENGDKQDVIKYLMAYQNPDGGFAHALEPDCWNQQSTPVQTWVATRIIEEIGLEDKKHPMIVKILNYLETTPDFNGNFWSGLNTVPSNNEYPHAPWWSFNVQEESGYNPTASLTGFMLKYADRTSAAYTLGIRLLKEAYDYLISSASLESMHEVSCFVELYDYLKDVDELKVVDLNIFKDTLQQAIGKLLTYDTSLWNITYSCKPSLFIHSKESDFYYEMRELCDFECKFIQQTQNEDGTWSVTWNWNEYPEEWSISKNWWKTDIIIKNLKYLKAFH